MTVKAYFIWIRENWSRVGVVLGIFITIYLILIVLPRDKLLFVLMMYTPLYILHETEEYVFPGGFPQFLNKNLYRTPPDSGLLDTPAIFVINMVVWFFFPLSGFQAITDLSQAGWMPYFVIFQAVVHLILGIVGKRLLNPGMITAWLVHVPWAVWTISLLMKAGLFSNPFWNAYVCQGILINLAFPAAGFALWVRYRRRQKRPVSSRPQK